MEWITPKTDWSGHYDATGYFDGDYINIEDYNRIKNNILYLREMAKNFFGKMPRLTIPVDKHEIDPDNEDFDNDNYFADEWNEIEDAFETLVNKIGRWYYGEKKTFYDNGHMIDYAELNRLERAELSLYNHMIDAIKGQKRLAFRLGTSSRDIKI